VTLHGRVSTLIVTEGGENVQPEDVERNYERHPFIREIGVLEHNRKLVGLIVPDLDAIPQTESANIEDVVEQAVREQSRTMASYMRLAEVRVTRDALPRTRLGKIRRHLLAERCDKGGSKGDGNAGEPMSVEAMSDHDRSLLDNATARLVWDWLSKRFPDGGLSPDTSLQTDLDVDSMAWLNLTLEIRDHAGVEIDEKTISRIETVRDLLEACIDAAAKPGHAVDPVERPLDVLNDEQKRWLQPLGPFLQGVAWLGYGLTALLLRLVFRIRIEGRNRVPSEGACVLTPNHTSYADPFALGYALGPRSLPRTCWAGVTTAAFDTRAKRFGCRLGRAVPITPDRGAISGLAFAAAILKRGQRLVWFPEGRRSRNGTLQEFRPGLGKVLERIRVPVIPVWIQGAYELWPLSRRLPKPGPLHVIFGEPVSIDILEAEGEGADAAERIIDGLRQRVAQLQP